MFGIRLSSCCVVEKFFWKPFKPSNPIFRTKISVEKFTVCMSTLKTYLSFNEDIKDSLFPPTAEPFLGNNTGVEHGHLQIPL